MSGLAIPTPDVPDAVVVVGAETPAHRALRAEVSPLTDPAEIDAACERYRRRYPDPERVPDPGL